MSDCVCTHSISVCSSRSPQPRSRLRPRLPGPTRRWSSWRSTRPPEAPAVTTCLVPRDTPPTLPTPLATALIWAYKMVITSINVHQQLGCTLFIFSLTASRRYGVCNFPQPYCPEHCLRAGLPVHLGPQLQSVLDRRPFPRKLPQPLASQPSHAAGLLEVGGARVGRQARKGVGPEVG